MINFIVCDDDKNILNKTKDIIDKSMLKNDIHYNKHLFNDYDNNFRKIANKKLANKIYIMDIATPSESGIDMAREIRSYDVNSIIIFMTAHNELGVHLLHNEIMFLAFINKFDNFNNRMEESINKAIKMIGVSQILKFKTDGSYYLIPYDDILYITNSSITNRALIVTKDGEYIFSANLKELAHILDSKLIRSHRKCYVNTENIRQINNDFITFNSGIKIPYISSNYKKEIMKYI